MAHHVSDLYPGIADRVTAEFNDRNWLAARKWRNRVGIPRLIVQAVVYEAFLLLRSANKNSLRRYPELMEKLDVARAACRDLNSSLTAQNWQDFQKPRDTYV